MKNKNYIELLESKGFEDDSIAKIQNFFVRHESRFSEDKDIYNLLNDIFIIFQNCGCSNCNIEQIINNNTNMLLAKKETLIKSAYVWNRAGVLNIMNSDGCIKINDYKNIFLRILFLESSIKRNQSPISYNALKMSNDEFALDYHSTLPNSKEIFYPYYENLIKVFIKDGSTTEEKEAILERFLTNKSILWWSSILKKEKEYEDGRIRKSI